MTTITGRLAVRERGAVTERLGLTVREHGAGTECAVGRERPGVRERGAGARATQRRWGRGLLPLIVPFLWLVALPVQAGSRTAESIWSQSDAQQRAVDQIPREDREGITQTRCQEVGVGRMGSLPRFRCTVWFNPTAPATPASP